MIHRWVFHDPAGHEADYTVPRNPNAMTPVFPQKAITALTTTAVDGQVLLFRGQSKPTDWQFAGDIVDEAHYEALRHWVYDKTNRLQITDHFGRVLTVVLSSFEPTPKRSVQYYWRHTYTVKGLLIKVGAPTVLA